MEPKLSSSNTIVLLRDKLSFYQKIFFKTKFILLMFLLLRSDLEMHPRPFISYILYHTRSNLNNRSVNNNRIK